MLLSSHRHLVRRAETQKTSPTARRHWSVVVLITVSAFSMILPLVEPSVGFSAAVFTSLGGPAVGQKSNVKGDEYDFGTSASDVKINGFESPPLCDDPSSNREGQFEVIYGNSSLPPNSKISLHHGWERLWPDGGKEDWTHIEEPTMDPVAFGTWSLTLKKQLVDFINQSKTETIALDFIFKIELPEGGIQYDKGNRSRLGFYRGSWAVTSPDCAVAPSTWPLDVNIANFIRD